MILALILAAASASADAPAPQTAAAPAEARKAEMICHKETLLGSRFPRTVCRPKGSAEALGAEERRAVESAQHSISMCGKAGTPHC